MKAYMALQKIVETGSFSKAAELLGCTNSALSQMIAGLESEWSVSLVNRSRAGIKLTPEGEEIYPYIERALHQYRAMAEKINEVRGLEGGVVRIGTLASISAHWLPGLMRSFQEEYPLVQFVLRQGNYTDIQEWVKEGAVDFGFVNPKAVTGLETLFLREMPMLAVLPQDHPLAEEKTVPLEELADEPFILLEEGHYYEPLECLRQLGLRPDIKYTIRDNYAIMTMVEAGLGVSVLSELLLHRVPYRLALRPTNPPILRTLALGYRDRQSLPRASKCFISHLRAHLEELP